MSQRIKGLLEERMKLVADCRAVLDLAEKEKRGLTAEEQTAYEARDKQIDEIGNTVTMLEKQEQREALMAAPRPAQAMLPATETAAALPDEEQRFWGARATPEYGQEFRAFLRDGFVGATLRSYERRDGLTAGNPTAAGFIVTPQTFIAELIKFVDDAVLIRGLARKFRVESAASLGAPSLDTDVADSDWTPEITATSVDTALAFGKRELTPHQLTKEVKISRKLLRQAVINPEAVVRERLGYKFAVTEEKAFLSGTGVQQPLGVFTASALGISTGRDVSTGNSTTSILFDGLKEAKYTLKAAYWPRAAWIFHRDAVKQVDKLKDGDGQYIWQPAVVPGAPDRLLGFPLGVSEFAPNTFTTGLYVGILGDFSNYWIADALNVDIQVLTELYARTNQNGYIGRAEVDGMPVLEEAFVRVKLA